MLGKRKKQSKLQKVRSQGWRVEGEYETYTVMMKEAKRLRNRGYEVKYRKQKKNNRYLLMKRAV